MSWFSPVQTILLTGAGFTKDFGGHLASEMWAAILNQPQISSTPRLRTYLLEQLNFEKAYDAVLTSESFTSSGKIAFTEALRGAYLAMDAAINQNKIPASALCTNFVSRFSGSSQKRGFFFTLNQDLLVERFFSSSSLSTGLLKIPGLEHNWWFNGKLPENLDTNYRVPLPNESELKARKQKFSEKSPESFAYVKLHGSYGWIGADGRDAMVIGFEKEGSISREPLLQWYFDLFQEALVQGDTKLVVIGYGFRDKHINDVIAEAIPHGLRIYIVSPLQPEEFKAMLEPVHGFNVDRPHQGAEIWKGIFGYYCGRVTDFFRVDSSNLTPQGLAFFKQVDLL